MPEGPYVRERQTEYWTSRQIEDYFLNAGFDILVFPLGQPSEKELPADFIFFDKKRLKLVGLQYKALYRNASDHWRLTAHQHDRMRKHYPWIYYAASEMRSSREHRNALHYTRFFSPGFRFQANLPVGEGPRYFRWGGFYQAFERCKVGVRIRSRRQLEEQLWPFAQRDMPAEIADLPDVFLADLDDRHVVHYSPFLRLNGQG